MARVTGAGNKSTEIRLLKLLRAMGLKGWRRKYPLTGKPDFVFAKQRVALFVDGCFWHGCPAHYRRPKSRRDFWDAKVRMNVARDEAVRSELHARGWKVLRVWEHELDSRAEPELRTRLRDALSAD